MKYFILEVLENYPEGVDLYSIADDFYEEETKLHWLYILEYHGSEVRKIVEEYYAEIKANL